MVDVALDTRQWRQLNRAYGDLGRGQLETGIRRGINQTGNKSRTKGYRATSQKAGVPLKMIRPKFRTYPARGPRLEYRLAVSDRYIKLADLGGVRQSGGGVSARYWGAHKGAFIATMASGHRGVFKRTGGMNRVSGRNNAIAELYGPNIARAFQDEGEQAFADEADRTLMPAIMKRMDGVVKQVGRRRGLR